MQESVRSRVAGSRPFSGGEICAWIEDAKKINEAHTTKEGRDERKENVKYKRNSFSASRKHIKTRNIKGKIPAETSRTLSKRKAEHTDEKALLITERISIKQYEKTLNSNTAVTLTLLFDPKQIINQLNIKNYTSEGKKY